MANYYGNLENYLCWPTENDHYGAGVIGDARVITELNMTPLLAGLAGRNCVLSGFALPTNTSGTPNPITAGTAIVSGVYISGAGTYTLTVGYTASSTNWVWLVLVRDGNGRVLRPEITVTAGATKPADPTDSVLLGSVTVNGSGVITTTQDLRYSGRILMGEFTTNGSGLSLVEYGTGGWTYTYSHPSIDITFTTPFLRYPRVHQWRFTSGSPDLYEVYWHTASSVSTVQLAIASTGRTSFQAVG